MGSGLSKSDRLKLQEKSTTSSQTQAAQSQPSSQEPQNKQ